MGTTATPIKFFHPDFAITPYTASHAHLIGRPIKMDALALGMPVALYELDNGNYRAEVRNFLNQPIGRFIEGPASD